jgi:hypothetical protein
MRVRTYFHENGVINNAKRSLDGSIWYHDKIPDTEQCPRQVDAKNQKHIQAQIEIIWIVLRVHNDENNVEELCKRTVIELYML